MTDVADGFELLGAGVLVFGFAAAFVRAGALDPLVRAPGARSTGACEASPFGPCCSGSRVLVAADLIRTVAVEPSWESVGVLTVIVLIRTFLELHTRP